MTRRHLNVLLVGVGALVLATIARELPPRPGRAPPCAAPRVVERGGRAVLRCGGGATERGLGGEQRLLLGLPIDLNQASAADLEALPRIGPALARRIVADRRARGRFRTVAALARVKGIGPVTVRRLRGLVVAAAPVGHGGAGR